MNFCPKCQTELLPQDSTLQITSPAYNFVLKTANASVCPSCNYVHMDIPAEALKCVIGPVVEEKEYLTLDEVASLLKVSKQTVYNMVHDGRLTSNKCGRQWRFSKEDIENLLK